MKSFTFPLAVLARTAGIAAAFLVVAAGGAEAQRTSGSWQPWLGCWSAGPEVGGVAPTALGPVVCITPTADANAVEFTTIADDSVVATQRVEAGRELPLTAKGCAGVQGAEWSTDQRRVYLKATTTCSGVERTTSGIIAMSPEGDWLDVQGVAERGNDAVRVARYHEVSVPRSAPSRIAAALGERRAATLGTRFATGGTIGSAAVIEASRKATPAVVEAWLMERGQLFALDAQELLQLADAGVPARVTDAMVAVSNPTVFAVARSERAARERARLDDDQTAGRRVYVYMDPSYSPYGWGYSPYGYSSLGYGRYGTGYGGGYYGYPGYQTPIVIAPPQPAVARGRAVKGRGYTQGDPGGTAAQPTNTRGTESTSGSPSAGSGSQPASQPAPRTAHPKP